MTPQQAREIGVRIVEGACLDGQYTDLGAHLSECGRYRYCLTRRWREYRAGSEPRNTAVFIGLNPSTANATDDDPTIRRCVAFAKGWGYGGLVMLNLFAFRATDPRDMLAAADPIGPENWRYLRAAEKYAGVIVAAWGNGGSHMGRAAAVRELLPNLHFLKLNKDGSPGHPLYLRASLIPQFWV